MSDSTPTPAPEAPEQESAATRRRRAQTAPALIGAILATLAIVAFLILVVVRPDQSGPTRVDWRAAAVDASNAIGTEVIQPAVPDTWTANFARVHTETVPEWEVGFMTPRAEYIEFSQVFDSGGPVFAAIAYPEGASGEIEIDGIVWQFFDNSSFEDVGNDEYSMYATWPDYFVALNGTADVEEFHELASAVAKAVQAR